MDTTGAIGARLSNVTVPELEPVSPESSVTVAVHMMVSVFEAVAADRVTVEPVPNVAPVVMLVQAKLSVSKSLSSSLPVNAQLRVLSLLGAAGLMTTLSTFGAVLAMVTEEEAKESVSFPSSAWTLTKTLSPLSK
jgi:hypothetical protein